MHTFYYPHQAAHDPALLHRAHNARLATYYADIPVRATAVHNTLQTAALGDISPPADFGLEPIAAVHQHDLITFLQTAYERIFAETGLTVAIPETFSMGPKPQHKPVSIWGQLGYFCFDTAAPIFEDTWDVAYWSVQTAVSAAALVRAGGERFAYALCCPPGHHAAADRYGGFCYLNNAAIAAQWLVDEGQRVAVLDIDLHHGNGAQAIFYNRADVLTCSIHADPLYEYPYYWGFADEYGRGQGVNHNFNIPLPLGTQEAQYLTAVDEALRHIHAFVPDSLIISFGADTLDHDPVGGFKLTVESYGRIAAKITALNLPAIIIQEGGYLVPQLGDCVVSFLKGLEAG